MGERHSTHFFIKLEHPETQVKEKHLKEAVVKQARWSIILMTMKYFTRSLH